MHQQALFKSWDCQNCLDPFYSHKVHILFYKGNQTLARTNLHVLSHPNLWFCAISSPCPPQFRVQTPVLPVSNSKNRDILNMEIYFKFHQWLDIESCTCVRTIFKTKYQETPICMGYKERLLLPIQSCHLKTLQ